MIKIKERDTKSSEQVEDKVLLGTISTISKRIGMSVNALRGLFILLGIFNTGFSIIVYIVGTVLVGRDKLQEPQDSETILGSILEDSMSKYISGNATTESKHAQTMTVDDLPPLDEDGAYHSLSFVGSEEADVTDQVKDEPSVSEGLSTIRDELGSNNLDGLVDTDISEVWDDEISTDELGSNNLDSLVETDTSDVWEEVSSIDELGSNNLDGLLETDTSEVWEDESNIDDIWGEKTKSIWDEEKPNIWD